LSASDSHLVVKLPALKRTIERVTGYSISSNYLTSTDGFEFSAFDPDRSKLQNLECQPVELLIHEASQLIGRIDVSRVGDNGSAYTFSGRDYIADIVECNVDPALKITAGMNLFDAFLLAMGPVGIYEVVDDADVGLRNVRSGKTVGAKKKKRKRRKLSQADIKPEPGQGIYEFCNKIAARQGCTIQPSDRRRAVTLAQPNFDQDPLYTISRYDDPTVGQSNNVISATCARDYSRFPTFTMLSGHQAKAGVTAPVVTTTVDTLQMVTGFGLGNFRPSALIINSSGVGSGDKSLNKTLDGVDFAKTQAPEIAAILESSIHRGRRKPPASGGSSFDVGKLYRLLFHRDADAKDEEQLFQGAARAIAERLKDTLEYRATLKGHVDPASGAIWSVDTIVNVSDAICNVQEPLWIAERTLRFSPQDGATTEIVAWRPGSFQIGSEE